ncbi:site-specific integrase [Uliginosibacterium sp. 31-12]|uniref:site-specific integrase n=1 Tax=Uliginosibacterium sp. 31-12 TaxID=3062781 RepID=UPI0026E3C511|nr:site-specific integrase [Uliginosibacterium sp. 31-12]MDO6387906.1 site-specific integrase [Uliginosibacterium sp. 31-12]
MARNTRLSAETLTEADLMAAARAASTRSEYAKDVQYFVTAGYSIPATVAELAEFITKEATRIKPRTLARRLVAIHVAHTEHGHASPVHAPRIKQLMKGIRRSVGTAPRQVAALMKTDLLELLLVANKGRPMQAARDVALLLVGWVGAFRRSEVANLRVEDVTWLDGSGIEILLRHSKVDQEGQGYMKFLPASHGAWCPSKALQHWLEVSGITTGHMFRPINRHDQIGGAALTPHSVARIVKRLAEQAGRDPGAYSGHSLRSGFVSAGILAGVPSHQLMQVTGHRSEATLQKYVRIRDRRKLPSLL